MEAVVDAVLGRRDDDMRTAATERRQSAVLVESFSDLLG